ncbi:MAG TPA: NAD(P)H-dependent oxidoreductase subunit E [Acidimicrobiales bacterium]
MSRLTAERVALARQIIGRYPVARSALVPLIHLAQEQDGYVTDDAMEHIAELIGCTPAEVYGTGSFYEMFKFHPVGKYVVGVCTNISCLLAGADELLAHCERSLGVRTGGTTSDGVFTLEDVECIAACTVAPCLQVNYRYFPDQTPDAVDRLFADLRAGALDEEVPPHGVLARIRQRAEPSRWAGTGTAPPPTTDLFTGPALAAPGPTAPGPTAPESGSPGETPQR